MICKSLNIFIWENNQYKLKGFTFDPRHAKELGFQHARFIMLVYGVILQPANF